VRDAMLEEIVDLRHRILRAGLPRESALWEADHDPHTRHFAALLDGRIVGCATLILNRWQDQPAWQLRGMAIEDGRRGQGIGRQLLEHVEGIARASNTAHMLWCNARTSAVAFYSRQGWRTVGEEFVIPSAGPHLKMIKLI
jgi:GNAT superfamily N-acetyltransferase